MRGKKSDPLESVKKKIKRAHKDIEKKVAVAVHNFRFRKPYRFDIEPHTDGLQEVAKIRFTGEIPDDIADDASSALQNLRSALDYLAWAVANRHGIPLFPEQVKFPIHKYRW